MNLPEYEQEIRAAVTHMEKNLAEVLEEFRDRISSVNMHFLEPETAKAEYMDRPKMSGY